MAEKDRSESQRFNCIYDAESLGFEKDPLDSAKKILVQDPLEEIDIADKATKNTTYISRKIGSSLKNPTIELLKGFKDCFTYDYNEMSRLGRDLMKLKFSIRHDKIPEKQTPRRFAPKLMLRMKEEIERLMRNKVIRTLRYVE